MTGGHVKVAFLLEKCEEVIENIKYSQKLKFIRYELNRKKG